MKKIIYKKIDKNTYQRIMDVEQEDIFTLTNLKQEKRDLEETISTPQKRLNEITDILKEIEQIKQG